MGTVLFFGTLFLLIVGVATMIPILTGRRIETSSDDLPEDATFADLEAALARHINGVRDLDFDFDTDKVSQEEYEIQRKYLVGRGISTMIRLDEHQQQVDHQIELLITDYRKQG